MVVRHRAALFCQTQLGGALGYNMLFGLGGILLGALLMVNGLAVLNNDRFLEKRGWGFSQIGQKGFTGSPNAVKYQIIGVIHAVTYLRVPLIFINSVVVIGMLIF